MNESWKMLKELRETTISISGRSYSVEFIKKNIMEDTRLTWIPEPIEVAINENGEVICRLKKVDRWHEDDDEKEKFVTSAGTFISHNHGEFGGELITPVGRLEGNFVEVFECCGKIYAIDSCNHMGMGHINIYTFSEDLEAIRLFASKHFHKDGQEIISEWISLKALYVDHDSAYIFASGYVSYDHVDDKKERKKIAYLFEITNNGITKKAEFGGVFDWVKNIIVHDGQLFVGMDKVVAVVDLTTKEIKAFTPISVEAEQDLLNGINQFKNKYS